MPRNTNSESSDVHEARVALGSRLRELRRLAQPSGKQLAESLAWPPSKISKLENARQTPTEDDIRDWARATRNEEEAAGLIVTLQTLEERHAEWHRQLSTGMRHVQNKIADQEAKVRFFRVFQPEVVPGLLQVPEYAMACLNVGRRVVGAPDDLIDAVPARMRRQEISSITRKNDSTSSSPRHRCDTGGAHRE